MRSADIMCVALVATLLQRDTFATTLRNATPNVHSSFKESNTNDDSGHLLVEERNEPVEERGTRFAAPIDDVSDIVSSKTIPIINHPDEYGNFVKSRLAKFKNARDIKAADVVKSVKTQFNRKIANWVLQYADSVKSGADAKLYDALAVYSDQVTAAAIKAADDAAAAKAAEAVTPML